MWKKRRCSVLDRQESGAVKNSLKFRNRKEAHKWRIFILFYGRETGLERPAGAFA